MVAAVLFPEPIYRGYVDITINDKKKRFYYDNHNIEKKTNKMKMDRVAFLIEMGFAPEIIKYSYEISWVEADVFNWSKDLSISIGNRRY